MVFLNRLVSTMDGPACRPVAIDGVFDRESILLDTCCRIVKDDLDGFARSIERGGGDFDLGKDEVSMLGSSRAVAIQCEGFEPKGSDIGLLGFDCDIIGVSIRDLSGGGDKDFLDTQLGVFRFC